MKKVFAILLLVSSLVSAQENIKGSLLELKNQIEIKQNNQDKFSFSNEPEKKSPMVAIAYSLLLPGMGELYGGDYSLGKYLTIADAVFWGGVIGFNIYGGNQEDNYKAYAESIGGVNVNGKDEQYFADISEYISIEQFNTEQEKYREFENLYNEETHYWNWGDNKTRQEYRGMWSKSESAYNNVRFAVGALVLNRVISAINAVRVVAAYNKKLNEEMSWNVSVGIKKIDQNLPSSLKLNFSCKF
ncbi:MAG: hypothetical protein F9K45_02585 [Melioribacteraceae bacterium]|nr:MAG: hypothetical protein F9K45_02585 [Melioribacteraceae bacterium]